MSRALAPLRFDDGAAVRWARLVRCAQASAARPLADASALGSAAMKAGKTASIPGQHHSGSDGLELVRLGRTFAGLSTGQRVETAPRLGQLAARVAAALAAAEAQLRRAEGARSRPFRADIDG
jgi:hypothetical protein